MDSALWTDIGQAGEAVVGDLLLVMLSATVPARCGPTYWQLDAIYGGTLRRRI